MLCLGEEVRISNLSLRGLLPDTSQYMTYDGSMTYPPCLESVTWIIPNRPLYMTQREVRTGNDVTRLAIHHEVISLLSLQLRQMHKVRVGRYKPPMPANRSKNRRPVKPRTHRTVRTNLGYNFGVRNQPKTIPTSNIRIVAYREFALFQAKCSDSNTLKYKGDANAQLLQFPTFIVVLTSSIHYMT